VWAEWVLKWTMSVTMLTVSCVMYNRGCWSCWKALLLTCLIAAARAGPAATQSLSTLQTSCLLHRERSTVSTASSADVDSRRWPVVPTCFLIAVQLSTLPVALPVTQRTELVVSKIPVSHTSNPQGTWPNVEWSLKQWAS